MAMGGQRANTPLHLTHHGQERLSHQQNDTASLLDAWRGATQFFKNRRRILRMLYSDKDYQSN